MPVNNKYLTYLINNESDIFSHIANFYDLPSYQFMLTECSDTFVINFIDDNGNHNMLYTFPIKLNDITYYEISFFIVDGLGKHIDMKTYLDGQIRINNITNILK